MKLINSLFDYQNFMPHGYCFLWVPEILWSQIIAEIIIASAYIIISLTLFYLVIRRKNIPFSWIVVLYGVFILLCGLTHITGLLSIWYPIYVLDSILKIVTAAVSIAAAFVMFPLIPKLLSLFELLPQNKPEEEQKDKE